MRLMVGRVCVPSTARAWCRRALHTSDTNRAFTPTLSSSPINLSAPWDRNAARPNRDLRYQSLIDWKRGRLLAKSHRVLAAVTVSDHQPTHTVPRPQREAGAVRRGPALVTDQTGSLAKTREEEAKVVADIFARHPDPIALLDAALAADSANCETPPPALLWPELVQSLRRHVYELDQQQSGARPSATDTGTRPATVVQIVNKRVNMNVRSLAQSIVNHRAFFLALTRLTDGLNNNDLRIINSNSLWDVALLLFYYQPTPTLHHVHMQQSQAVPVNESVRRQFQLFLVTYIERYLSIEPSYYRSSHLPTRTTVNLYSWTFLLHSIASLTFVYERKLLLMLNDKQLKMIEKCYEKIVTHIKQFVEISPTATGPTMLEIYRMEKFLTTMSKMAKYSGAPFSTAEIKTRRAVMREQWRQLQRPSPRLLPRTKM